MDYPNIVPCLVVPFEGACADGARRFPALVFARRGSVVLFADEDKRRFGVGVLAEGGEVTGADQYATLDRAAREFLSCTPHRQRLGA
jgi:hypothetical protein